MRSLLFVLATIGLFTTCTEKENQSLAVQLKNASTPPQVYTIKQNTATTITTKGGIKLYLPPNLFVLENGEKPEEPFQLEIKDVFKKSEMILNTLSTVSDGHLLETFGMMYIQATANGKNLKIKKGEAITISIPNTIGKLDGELFYGAQVGQTINWNYAGTTRDTIRVEETKVPLSNGKEKINRTTYRYKNGYKEFISDTILLVKRNFILEGDSSYDTSSYSIESYEFNITQLGWINCDRFAEISEKIDCTIIIEEYSQPLGYLVFKNINSVMPVLFNKNGKATLQGLPKAYTAQLIILDKIKGKHRWANQIIKIGELSAYSVKTQPDTFENILKEIRNVDK
jgi:hypothetical protein